VSWCYGFTVGRSTIGVCLLALGGAACGGKMDHVLPIITSPAHDASAGQNDDGGPDVSEASDAGEAPDLGTITSFGSNCSWARAGNPSCSNESGFPGPAVSVGCAYDVCYSSGVCTGCACIAVDGGAAWYCSSVQPDSAESDDSGPDGCRAMGGSCLLDFDSTFCEQALIGRGCGTAQICCITTGAAPIVVAEPSDSGQGDDGGESDDGGPDSDAGRECVSVPYATCIGNPFVCIGQWATQLACGEDSLCCITFPMR
jgi:hypothetical protein